MTLLSTLAIRITIPLAISSIHKQTPPFEEMYYPWIMSKKLQGREQPTLSPTPIYFCFLVRFFVKIYQADVVPVFVTSIPLRG